jgi:hypothetical protein
MTSKRELRAMVERLTAQLELANAERDAADKRARALSVDLCIAQSQCHRLKVDLKASNDRVPGTFSGLFDVRRTWTTPDEAA